MLAPWGFEGVTYVKSNLILVPDVTVSASAIKSSLALLSCTGDVSQASAMKSKLTLWEGYTGDLSQDIEWFPPPRHKLRL